MSFISIFFFLYSVFNQAALHKQQNKSPVMYIIIIIFFKYLHHCWSWLDRRFKDWLILHYSISDLITAPVYFHRFLWYVLGKTIAPL